MTDIFRKVSRILHEKNISIVSAESCTGGWLAKRITDLEGSSAIFDRGFVTYSNQAKQDMLGVSKEIIDCYGAVSEQVAIEMVKGALANSQADIALSISGIAGPGGGTAEKPVGTVCFGWMRREREPIAKTLLLLGDRNKIREQAVDISFEGIINQI